MGYRPPPFRPRKPDKPPPAPPMQAQRRVKKRPPPDTDPPNRRPFFVKCEYCGRYPEPDRPYCPGCGRGVDTFPRSEKREAIVMDVKVNPDLDPKELGRLSGKKIFELTPEILEDPRFISVTEYQFRRATEGRIRTPTPRPDPPKPGSAT